MDRKSIHKLKLDKRLIRRRGWISAEELERELEGLPDVAGKVAEPEPESEEEESAP
jgi:hypothetical protein